MIRINSTLENNLIINGRSAAGATGAYVEIRIIVTSGNKINAAVGETSISGDS